MPEALRFAVVCSSNQNRSMEAHAFLRKKGFDVRSFGTGSQVKIPGATPDRPNVYDFSVSYDEMYHDLLEKDKTLYTQNGLLHMLDRNRRIKSHPERFQDCFDIFDVIFTVDERVFDQVLEELLNRNAEELSIVHVINIDVEDNHEEATIAAFLIRDIATKMVESEDLDNEIDELVQAFELKSKRQMLHIANFY